MSEQPAERWLTAEQLAERWDCDASTIRNQRRLGKGPKGWARLVTKVLRVPESNVIEWEKQQQEAFADEVAQWAPPRRGAA